MIVNGNIVITCEKPKKYTNKKIRHKVQQNIEFLKNYIIFLY